MSIEVFFNRPGRPVPVERLYREIRDARHRLTVASAWFTDTQIADAILDAPAPNKLVLLNAADLGRGDKRAVKMIKDAAAASSPRFDTWTDERDTVLSDWHYRHRDKGDGLLFWKETPESRAFIAEWEISNPAPNVVCMVVLGSRDFTQGVMHHKFIAIDNRMLWTGSFNFTFNAQRNYENLIRIDDPIIVLRYHAEAQECAAQKGGDDSSGMIKCGFCSTAFYPDEQDYETDSQGWVICKACLATSAVRFAFDTMPNPLQPPSRPTPRSAPPKPQRQVGVGKKRNG